MAFPTIASNTGGNNATNSTSSTINLGSPSSGQRCIVSVIVDQNTGSAFTGWPSGFTQVAAVDNSTVCRLETRYKDCDGSEGASFSLGHQNNMSAHKTVLLTAGTFDPATAPAVSTTTGSGNPSPDPLSLDPGGWGTEDTKWLVVCAYDDGLSVFTDPDPANYTVVGSAERSASGQGVGIAVAHRDLAASSDDPGPTTLDNNEAWIAFTIAIRPASAPDLAVLANASRPTQFMSTISYV